MKRSALHIIVAFVAVVWVLGACSRARVIPRGKMVDIYADMFMADQWIKEDYSLRRQADTSLLYEPILESYGYTTDDYLKSVRKYMKDPERFGRILKKTAKKLERENTRLSAKLSKIRYSHSSRDEVTDWVRQVISMEALDSIVFSRFKVPSDTSYDGVRIIIDSSWRIKVDTTAARVDSLPVRDSSVIRKDTVAIPKDTLPRRKDTLARRLLRRGVQMKEKVLDNLE